MKRFWQVLTLVASLGALTVLGAELDPAYLAKFGYGKLLVSGKGALPRDAMPKDGLEQQEGAFVVQGGSAGRMDLRVILPKGETVGSLVAKRKQARAPEAKGWQEDTFSFRIWSNLDRQGNETFGPGMSWPTRLTDEPKWAAPIFEYTAKITPEMKAWSTQALSWDEHLQGELSGILADARPGMKLYVAYYVGFTSMTGKGKMESKWDDVLQKFVPVKSSGELERVFGPAVAASTVMVVSDKPALSCKIDQMPTALDEVAEGMVTLLKGTEELGKARLLVKFKFTETRTKISSYDVTLIKTDDEAMRGGFPVESSTAEKAVSTACRQFLERHFSN